VASIKRNHQVVGPVLAWLGLNVVIYPFLVVLVGPWGGALDAVHTDEGPVPVPVNWLQRAFPFIVIAAAIFLGWRRAVACGKETQPASRSETENNTEQRP